MTPYNPRHNGYDISRFLDAPTLTPDEWRQFVTSGEIVLFRDRLAELLRVEKAVGSFMKRLDEFVTTHHPESAP